MGFSDPITAGNELVRDDIHSSNFVSSVSGWRVLRTGNAEFNDILARGTMHLQNANGDRLDLHVAPNTRPSVDYALGTTPLNTTNATLYLDVNPFWGTSQFNILWSDSVSAHILLRESEFGRAQILLDVPINTWDRTGLDSNASEVWHDVSFQNGWTNTGGVFAHVQYRLMGDASTVRLRGLASAGTKTDGTILFNLNANYRPSFENAQNVVTDVAGNTPEIQITTAGDAKIFRLGTGNVVGFDGYTFRLDGV